MNGKWTKMEFWPENRLGKEEMRQEMDENGNIAWKSGKKWRIFSKNHIKVYFDKG